MRSSSVSFLYDKKAVKMESSTTPFDVLPWFYFNHSIPIPSAISVLKSRIATILFISCEKLNSQTPGCQHHKPNKTQTTTTTWQNLFKSNKDLTVKRKTAPVSLTLSSQYPSLRFLCDVGCEVCSQRAYSKMHVQSLCREVDVPVMTKKVPWDGKFI